MLTHQDIPHIAWHDLTLGRDTQYCGIEESINLLLELLSEAYNHLPGNPAKARVACWKSKDIQLMKSHASKQYY